MQGCFSSHAQINRTITNRVNSNSLIRTKEEAGEERSELETDSSEAERAQQLRHGRRALQRIKAMRRKGLNKIADEAGEELALALAL